MPSRSSHLALTLLSSATLLVGGCQDAQHWPGAGQDEPVATSVPAAINNDTPVATDPQTAVVDPALIKRMERLEDRVDSVDANVSGLESDVAGLQTDMTVAKPQLAKLDSMERHFRQLSLELDRINNTYGVDATSAPVAKPVAAVPQKVPKPKTVEAKPVVAKTAPAPKAAPVAKKAATGPLKVQQVRIGEQANGKTRIVLDTTASAKINYDIDNGEKILLIEVPDAAWAAKQSQTLKNSGIVSSYKAENDAAGSRLIVQLKEPAQVVSTSRLDPSGDAGHRVFLDLDKK